MLEQMRPIVGADYPKVVVPLIKAARKNIDIVVYDWRWYADQPAEAVQQFNIALVNAVNRGVIVRAVVNAPTIVKLLNSVGIKGRQTRDRRTVHTKMILIDGKWCVIGSHNFSRNAFGANIETSVAVEIPEGVTRFADFFENLYAN